MEATPLITAAAGVYRTSLGSLAVLLTLSALLAISDVSMGLACAGGGLIALLPHLYMTARVFGISRKGVRPVTMGSLLAAEAVKLTLTGVMFGAAFIWMDPRYAGWLFLGFGVTLVANLAGVAKVVRRLDQIAVLQIKQRQNEQVEELKES